MDKYLELKRLAEAATPGPWYARDYGSYDGKGSHWFIDTEHPHDIVDDQDGGFSPNHWDDARGERDMKFIAAANPDVVLALIAENEALRKIPLIVANEYSQLLTAQSLSKAKAEKFQQRMNAAMEVGRRMDEVKP